MSYGEVKDTPVRHPESRPMPVKRPDRGWQKLGDVVANIVKNMPAGVNEG